MKELVTNLHIHTVYSDGSSTHRQIAEQAHIAGLDVIIVTDHNVLVRGIDPYYEKGGHKVLLLIGQEVHDPARLPQKSHMLVIGSEKDLANYAYDPQTLIDQANKNNALTFIAHPTEQDLPLFHQTDISWEDWQVNGYTGIELWNSLSEMKEVVHNYLDGFFYTSFPNHLASSPPAAALKKWDELLLTGKRIVAVGGSDAHALHFGIGPVKRTVLPYLYHFQAVNTHIFTPEALTGDFIKDRKMVLNALRQGNAFVGYDLPASTRGFRFTAQGKEQSAWMGDAIPLREGITLQIRLPFRTRCILVKNGKRVKAWKNRDVISQFIDEKGVYRVECYIHYLGKWRGWIFSNPIYVQ